MPLATYRFEDKYNIKCPICKVEKRIVYEMRNFGSLLVWCKACGVELLFISEIESLLIPLFQEKFKNIEEDSLKIALSNLYEEGVVKLKNKVLLTRKRYEELLQREEELENINL
jgi:translation initiation factor 2 beta subunit (eIF-2beta)/eIF-5